MKSDPYELDLVYVKQSEIPESGEGLFAKVDLPSGMVVSFYNGIKVPHKTVDRMWPLIAG